ncbi:hypothetical protein [Corynebacterium glucuronolyticum]|uniref:Uncharacterized protein n=2 Tax=Corynebacterium glucuronolyticum TaxID=39791 RepID=A0AAX1L861_9CORY|nr:hypothetical protein [Corynebacterium glucuronolyticum]EEI61875.1 hypothetical protein HMPREF0293_2609 [Corynebacterium glucuronolyticum ATCC 51866]QQU88549.1 hypothetical protein I6I68_00650 [Corynebacterium glucuronolyticum]QRP70579.1 hypothetical protein I6J21_12735 [Corynebacterium glucuronolyticum]
MSNTDIQLAPGENGVFAKTFSTNLVLFWLKTKITITNRRIVAKSPNTILGVIPLGYREEAMPIGSIAGISSNLTVKPGRLIGFGILAFILLFSGMGSLGSSAGSALFFILLALLFGALAANAILATLSVQNNGGGKNTVTVSALEQKKLEEFKTRANEFIYSAGLAGTSWNQLAGNNNQGFHNAQPHDH